MLMLISKWMNISVSPKVTTSSRGSKIRIPVYTVRRSFSNRRNREKETGITFHHHSTAGGGQTNTVLCFADVFATIKLGCLGQFQRGDSVRKLHQTRVGLAQLSVTFKPSDRDVGGSCDAARQCNRIANTDLLRLWLFNKVRSL